MNIIRIRTLAGANIFSYRPALVLQLEIAEKDESLLKESSDFARRIESLMPTIPASDSEMRAIRTAKNDLTEAVKNIALSLLSRAGLSGGASIRFSGVTGVYEIAVEYEKETTTRFVLESAVAAVEAVLNNQSFDIDRVITQAKELAAGESFDDSLSPNEHEKRIPIIAITGTNGKTTVTRLTAHTLFQSGLNVGTTTTDGILFNGEIIERGDTTGPASARKILKNAAVDVAVLETARGGIMRRGLGWNWADIGVVTNITEDHIGQDGIESVADLVDVKSLIAERVRAGGTLILNAADAESAALANRKSVLRAEKKIVFFAVDESNPILAQHSVAGETVYFVRDGWICENRGEIVTPIAETRLIPITMNGTADFQIQNALAVAAICRTLDLAPEKIAAGLYGFQSALHNSGRSNFYRVGKGYALIDYGHNPKAMEAICRMTSRWDGKTITGIVSFPGDRRDDVIEAAGRIAVAGFDRIIIKGDVNLRGRERGEVAEMLHKIVLETGAQKDCKIVLDAAQAFDDAIAHIGENEVVVFFYEKLAPVMATLEKYGAVATTEF